jgi:hypothetical protein
LAAASAKTCEAKGQPGEKASALTDGRFLF